MEEDVARWVEAQLSVVLDFAASLGQDGGGGGGNVLENCGLLENTQVRQLEARMAAQERQSGGRQGESEAKRQEEWMEECLMEPLPAREKLVELAKQCRADLVSKAWVSGLAELKAVDLLYSDLWSDFTYGLCTLVLGDTKNGRKMEAVSQSIRQLGAEKLLSMFEQANPNQAAEMYLELATFATYGLCSQKFKTTQDLTGLEAVYSLLVQMLYVPDKLLHVQGNHLFDRVTIGTFKLIVLSQGRKPAHSQGHSLALFMNADASKKGLWLERWFACGPSPQQLCYHIIASGLGGFLVKFGGYLSDAMFYPDFNAPPILLDPVQAQVSLSMLATIMGNPHGRAIIMENETILQPDIAFDFMSNGVCYLSKGVPELALDSIKDLGYVPHCNKLWRCASPFDGVTFRQSHSNAHWQDGSLTKLMVEIALQRNQVLPLCRDSSSLVAKCEETLVTLASSAVCNQDGHFDLWHPGTCLGCLCPPQDQSVLTSEVRVSARVFSALVASSSNKLASKVVLSDEFARMLRLLLAAAAAAAAPTSGPADNSLVEAFVHLVQPALEKPLLSFVVVDFLSQVRRKNQFGTARFSSLVRALASSLASTASGCRASWSLLTACCARKIDKLWLLPAGTGVSEVRRSLLAFRHVCLQPGSWAFLDQAGLPTFLWTGFRNRGEAHNDLPEAVVQDAISGLMLHLAWQVPFLATLAAVFPSDCFRAYFPELVACILERSADSIVAERLLAIIIQCSVTREHCEKATKLVTDSGIEQENLLRVCNQIERTRQGFASSQDIAKLKPASIESHQQAPSPDEIAMSGHLEVGLIRWTQSFRGSLESPALDQDDYEGWLWRGVRLLFPNDIAIGRQVYRKVTHGLSPGIDFLVPGNVISRAEQIIARSDQCKRLAGLLASSVTPIGCLVYPMLDSCFFNVLERESVIFQLSLYAFLPAASPALFSVALVNCVLLPRLFGALASLDSAGSFNDADRATASLTSAFQEPIGLDLAQRGEIVRFLQAHQK